jgi:hypothetical protein
MNFMQVVDMETGDNPWLYTFSNKSSWNPSASRDHSWNLDITTLIPTTTDGNQQYLIDPLQLEKYMNGFMAIIIIVLGLVGNSLTVIVLTRRTMHSSTNCLIIKPSVQIE